MEGNVAKQSQRKTAGGLAGVAKITAATALRRSLAAITYLE